MRLMTAAGVMVLAIVLFMLWLLTPVKPVPALYQAGDCRRIDLVDIDTGQKVTGAEDLALLPDGDSLIISAHDRFDEGLPNGGLYRVSLWSIRDAEAYSVKNLIGDASEGPPFRPHGIAVSRDGTRLAVINRTRPGAAVIEIGDLEGDQWTATKRLTGSSLCRANDLNFVNADVETLEITLDREACGTGISDLLPGSTTGRTAIWDGGRLQISRSGLSFPNGIYGPFVAETRKNRILRPAGEPVRLPGGPDNLNREKGRKYIVAMHPSLRRLWLYLNGMWPSSASRLARIDMLSSEVDVLFDDPTGTLFSAATSAIFAKNMLIAGSVGDRGLLICQRGLP